MRTLVSFPIMHYGYGHDKVGQVIESENGIRKLILTADNIEYEASDSELREQIKIYQEFILKTQEALRVLNEP